MSDKLKVKLMGKKDRSYELVLGEIFFDELAEYLGKSNLGNRVLIITDSNVKKLYGKKIQDALRKTGLKIDLIEFKAGEKSKVRETKQRIEDRMFELGLGRDTVILALGGGVTGDLAGFIAATFNRGIPYIQIPTTMLAMVDSSIGGKTGLDTRYGKNLIGAFYQPKRVYIDTDFLKTLPEKEYLNGLVELIKHAIIKDRDLFYFIGKYREKVLKKDPEILAYLIKKSCEIKSKIVEIDEHESSIRRILNFGHTIGHAIETLSDYKITHGFAVSIGMNVELQISLMLNYIEKHEVEIIRQLLKEFNLCIDVPEEMHVNDIIKSMEMDKKAIKSSIRFVLLEEIGKIRAVENRFSFNVDDEIIEKAIEECKKSR
ncbi:3-dehydroquinate synthase [Candidatus Woesearchaeota archaeon]|nr:3-dehydroquinate synthase [Candidatus Woesearchaeota archaeon]